MRSGLGRGEHASCESPQVCFVVLSQVNSLWVGDEVQNTRTDSVIYDPVGCTSGTPGVEAAQRAGCCHCCPLQFWGIELGHSTAGDVVWPPHRDLLSTDLLFSLALVRAPLRRPRLAAQCARASLPFAVVRMRVHLGASFTIVSFFMHF